MMKYTLTFGISRREATQRVMAAKLTRVTHKIAIQLHLLVESCNYLQVSLQAASPETFGYTFVLCGHDLFFFEFRSSLTIPKNDYENTQTFAVCVSFVLSVCFMHYLKRKHETAQNCKEDSESGLNLDRGGQIIFYLGAKWGYFEVTTGRRASKTVKRQLFSLTVHLHTHIKRHNNNTINNSSGHNILKSPCGDRGKE
jgi:hypothetical protein